MFAVCKDKEKRTLVKLMGPGGSGKSTLTKCIRMAMAELRGSPFSFDEREKKHKKLVMESNAIESTLILCARARALFPSECAAEPDLAAKMDKLSGQPAWTRITRAEAEMISALWNSKLIQDTWAQRQNFTINSNTAYLLSKVLEFGGKDGYAVTAQDVLETREETKLGEEFQIEMPTELILDCGGCCTGKRRPQDQRLCILDVGGQQYHQRANEASPIYREYTRNASIIFVVVPLGDVAQRVSESGGGGGGGDGGGGGGGGVVGAGLADALLLLDGCLCAPGNEHRNVVVFLNKLDLFEAAVGGSGGGAGGAVAQWLESAKAYLPVAAAAAATAASASGPSGAAAAAAAGRGEDPKQQIQKRATELVELLAAHASAARALKSGDVVAAQAFFTTLIRAVETRHRRTDSDGDALPNSFAGSLRVFATTATRYTDGLREALQGACKEVSSVLLREIGIMSSAAVENPVNPGPKGAKRGSVFGMGDSYGKSEFE